MKVTTNLPKGTVGIDNEGDRFVIESGPDDDGDFYVDFPGFGFQTFLDPKDIANIESVPEPAPTPTATSLNEDLIELAIKRDSAVRFEYRKSDGDPKPRYLRPAAIHEAQWTGGKYVVGEDLDRRDVRAFRLDRITGQVTIQA